MLLWCGVPAVALTYPSTTLDGVHGWTADGALVLEVTVHPRVPEPATGAYQRGELRYAVVQRGDTVSEQWLLAASWPEAADRVDLRRIPEWNWPKGHPIDGIPDRTAPDAAGWAAWRDAHPLVASPSRLAHPGGVQLEARSTARPPERRGESFVVATEAEPTLTVGLSNGGEGWWPVHRAVLPSHQDQLHVVVSARWTPDGRRVAALVELPEQDTMWGPVSELTVNVVPAAPLIGVLSPPGAPEAVSDAVVASIGDLGQVQRGPARAARLSSVVYYAPRYEPDARTIAARVPGGATVEPLTWSTAQHVVVALGASAAP